MKTPHRERVKKRKPALDPSNNTLKKSISVKILQAFCREEKYRKAQHVTLVTSANPLLNSRDAPPIFR